MQDLFDAMALVAEPVIQSYGDDFRVHDRKVILALKPGDALLWAPRDCGSHLIVLARAYQPNIAAMEHYRAVQSLAPATPWYSVQVNAAGQWFFDRRPDAGDLVARFDEQARAAEAKAIRELHL